MLILFFFDRIIGPVVFLTEPETLTADLSEEQLNQIKGLLDTADVGFFTHYFSQELNTANFIFDISSWWARGRVELLMVSAIISEDEPDYPSYERFLTKFVKKLKDYPEIFKAFYIEKGPENERSAIQKNYDTLKTDFKTLDKILSIKKIETEGRLFSLSKIKEQKAISLSSDIVKKLSSLTQEEFKKNCFFVFRTRGEGMKIDIIPVETDKVIRLAIIFGEQMTVTILQRISEVFAKHEDSVSLVFTSGICQELDKCVYEVYINTEMKILDNIIEEIYKIEGILEMEVKLIGIEQ